MAEEKKAFELPEGERAEVRYNSRSGNIYIIAFSAGKNTRILYSIPEKGGKLKKVASAKTPLELYDKIEALEASK